MPPIKFGVPCPEVGSDAKLDFTFDALAALQKDLGDSYIALILAGLDRHDTGIIKQLIFRALSGNSQSVESLLASLPIAELSGRLADALWLRLHGKPARATASAGDANV